jgi:hypothetical protein
MLFLWFLGGSFDAAQSLHEKYAHIMQIYSLYIPDTSIDEIRLMEMSYALKGKPVRTFLNQLSKDIHIGRKQRLDQAYIKKLQGLSRLIRKHAQFFKTHAFHNQLEIKYAFAFDNLCIANTVMARFGGDLPLRNFMKDLQDDLAQLESHEDKLHSRYGYLKSYNHALKIELIKIRNSIIYQDIYKEQCGAYARKNWWKAPFKVVEGICVGSYCVGNYVWNAITG